MLSVNMNVPVVSVCQALEILVVIICVWGRGGGRVGG